MGGHTEKQFVYLEQKHGRNTHPETKDVNIFPKEEEAVKTQFKSLIWGFPDSPVVKTPHF